MTSMHSGYPITWDISSLFLNWAEWEASYANAYEVLNSFQQLRNHIDNPESIIKYYTLIESFWELCNRLQMYAYLKYAKENDDIDAYNMMQRVEELQLIYIEKTEFFEDELRQLPTERLKRFSDDNRLKKYAPLLNDIIDNSPTSFSTADLSHLSCALSQPEHIYSTLFDLEIPAVSTILCNGDKVEVSDFNFNNLAHCAISRDEKVSVSRTFALRCKSFENTFAAILNFHASVALGLARLEGFDTVIEYQNHLFGLDYRMYFNAVEAINVGLPAYHNFLRLKKRMLNVGAMYIFDLKEKLSNYIFPYNGYDEIVDLARESIRDLGDEYIKEYDIFVSSGHVDAYKTVRKSKGGFTKAFGGSVMPFVSLNLVDVLSGDSLSVFSHEMGHALYGVFAKKEQPFYHHEIGTFMHEVCAIVNEILLILYCINSSENKDQRLYYVEQHIDMFNEYFWDSIRYGEFEKQMYEVVERGDLLNAQDLNQKMNELNNKYWNGLVYKFEGHETAWINISHFYQTYYVYQYAVSFAYALSIAYSIYEGDEAVAANYLLMLKKGASEAPSQLLSMVIKDTEDIYINVVKRYIELVNEYENFNSTMSSKTQNGLERPYPLSETDFSRKTMIKKTDEK